MVLTLPQEHTHHAILPATSCTRDLAIPNEYIGTRELKKGVRVNDRVDLEFVVKLKMFRERRVGRNVGMARRRTSGW